MKGFRKIAAIVLVIAGLAALVFGRKFYDSADGYRSEARTATGSSREMYERWAVESEQKGLYCAVGGVAALIVGSVLLYLPKLTQKKTGDPASAGTPGRSKLGSMLGILGAVAAGVALGMLGKDPGYYVFELSLFGKPFFPAAACLALLVFSLGYPARKPAVRDAGMVIAAAALAVNTIICFAVPPTWYGDQASRPDYQIAIGLYVELVGTLLAAAGAGLRWKARSR
jgi:hypothetical protein